MVYNVADAAASVPSKNLYDCDYYTWALEQARALWTRSTEALDWENLAEEVEGLARTEARELKSGTR